MTDKTLKDKKHVLIGLLNRGKWDNGQILFWIDEIIDFALTAERERLASEKKKKQVPSNGSVQESVVFIDELQKNLPKIMSQPMWCKRIPVAEKLEYIKAIASARRQLWKNVENQIPEVIGLEGGYQISTQFITYDIPEKDAGKTESDEEVIQ